MKDCARRGLPLLLAALLALGSAPWQREARAEAAASGQGSPPGAACAVLTDDGELVMMRVPGEVAEGPDQDVVDVSGRAWHGEVYVGFEEAAYASTEEVPWHPRQLDVTSFSVAEGSVVRPASCAWLLSRLRNMTACDLRGLDTSRATSMRGMFCDCRSLATLDASPLATSSVTDMAAMFALCQSLEALDLTGFDVRSVRTMGDAPGEYLGMSSLGMFSCCQSLADLRIEGWDTSGVEDMSAMFVQTFCLLPPPTQNLDTSSVTNMDSMFANCRTLTEIDLSNFDTSKATGMMGVFLGDWSLVRLDISSWDTSHAANLNNFFLSTSSLREVRLGERFSFSGAEGSVPWGVGLLRPAPTTEPYDGTWCLGGDVTTAVTPERMRDAWDGAAMAGTWVWTERSPHAIGYDLAGGTRPEGAAWPESFVAGTAQPLPTGGDAPTRGGWRFAGWADGAGAAVAEVPASAHEDYLVTATWEPLQASATFPVAIALVATPAADGTLSLAPADPDAAYAVANTGEVDLAVAASAEAAEGVALSGSDALAADEADAWLTPVVGGEAAARVRLSSLVCPTVVAASLAPSEEMGIGDVGGRMGGWPFASAASPLVEIHWHVGPASAG